MAPRSTRADGLIGKWGMHQSLGSDRGTCECGSPATEWAYLKNDPDELICEVSGQRYSLKRESYKGMCRSCHRRFDHIPAIRCKLGHDDWYIQPSGGRRCRTCNRNKQAERRKAFGRERSKRV